MTLACGKQTCWQWITHQCGNGGVRRAPVQQDHELDRLLVDEELFHGLAVVGRARLERPIRLAMWSIARRNLCTRYDLARPIHALRHTSGNAHTRCTRSPRLSPPESCSPPPTAQSRTRDAEFDHQTLPGCDPQKGPPRRLPRAQLRMDRPQPPEPLRPVRRSGADTAFPNSSPRLAPPIQCWIKDQTIVCTKRHQSRDVE